MTLVELSAVTAALLMAAVAVFQVALAMGLPLGEATMGGRARTVGGMLQGPYRVLALVSAVVLVLAGWLVLGRAGIVTTFLDGQALTWATWLVAAFLVLNTLSNLSGRHPLEKWGMASITLVSAVLVGYVALAAPG
jgi:hypothetical protein